MHNVNRGKYCTKCGWTSEDDKYCYADGTELVDRPHCECGYEFSPYDKFCTKCGKPKVK